MDQRVDLTPAERVLADQLTEAELREMALSELHVLDEDRASQRELLDLEARHFAQVVESLAVLLGDAGMRVRWAADRSRNEAETTAKLASIWADVSLGFREACSVAAEVRSARKGAGLQ